MKKRLVASIIVTVLFFSLMACAPKPLALDPQTDGADFSVDEIYNKYGDDVYSAHKKITSIPHTFECWIYVPQGETGAGVIWGNYDSHIVSYINFGVTNGSPRLNWCDSRNQPYNVIFDQVDVRTGDYVHLAVVHNANDGEIYCYINGELKQTKCYYPDFEEKAISGYFSLGGDQRKLNQYYFKGKIAEFNLYSDVRSKKEIKRDMASVDLSDDNLIVSYDLSNDNSGVNIADRSKNAIDLSYTNLWLTEEENEKCRDKSFERAYSFAVVGDTQYMTQFNPEKLGIMYQWIVDNKEKYNIQYSIGLGDITNRDTDIEWQYAKKYISIMDGVIPYSLVRGNHDLKNYSAKANYKYNSEIFGEVASTKGHAFDELFAVDTASTTDYVDQFINNGENGGVYEQGSVMNTWRILEVGTSKWLLLNLDYCPSDAVLEWAGDVCESHPDCKVIVSTHGYLLSDSSHITSGDPKEKGYKGIKLPKGENTSNDGSDMWDKFVSQHKNITMLLCGHISTNQILASQHKGVNGNTVTEILVDAQDYDLSLDGLGLVAMFNFNQDGTQVEVEYYSTVLERYYRATNTYVIDLNADATEYVNSQWESNVLVPQGDGTEQNPYIIENASNLLWISKQIDDTVGKASFDGVYFKQTADIDLDGKTITPIGHYYYSSDLEMYAFGGTYDGNGYTIKNGYIALNNPDEDESFSREYGYGLFGVIYGGTVKNVTMDNITVVGRGVTGTVVGKTAGKSDGSSKEDFNIIENCTVTDSCKILTLPADITTQSFGFESSLHSGIVGGLVGMARSATISGCSSSVDVNITDIFDTFGGIAGAAGYNTVISECTFDGGAKYNGEKTDDTIVSLGGIVAIASPNDETLDIGDNCIGTLTLQDCKNKSKIKPVIAQECGLKEQNQLTVK